MSNQLILRLVEVENFLGHEHELLELGPGVILLAGDSGAGKSSLISDAVGFALYDYRATRATKGTKSELRNWRYPGKDFFVRIALERTDGYRIEIKRGINERGASFVTSSDNSGGKGDDVATVREHLTSVIGMLDADTYFRSFVSRQDNHEVITDMQKGKRQAFVNRMLGIDIFGTIVTDSRKQGKAAGKRIEELMSVLGDSSLDALKAEQETMDKAIEVQRQLQNDAQAKLDDAQKQIEATLVQIQAAQASEKQRQELSGKHQSLQTEAAKLQGQMAASGSQVRSEMTQLDLQGEKIRDEGKVLRQQHDVMNELKLAAHARTELEARLAAKQTAITELEAKIGEKPDVGNIAAMRDQLRAHDQQRATLAAHEAQLVKRLSAIEEGVCDSCGRDFETDHDEHQRTTESELAQVRADLTGLSNLQDALQVTIRAAEAAQETLNQWQRRHDEFSRVKREAEELTGQLDKSPGKDYSPQDHEALATRLDAAREQWNRVKSARAWLAENPEPAALEQQLHALQQQQAHLEAELDALPAANQSEGLTNQERELRTAMSDHAATISSAKIALTDMEHTLQRAVSRLDIYARSSDELKEKQRENRQLLELAALTESFWQQLSEEVRPQLGEIASDLMNSISHGTHSRLELDSSYELYAYDDNNVAYPSRALSGGEKVRANFALRVALTRLITQRTGAPLGYLILDEIFSAQDPGHVERMVDILEKLQAHYPQIFLISHVGSIEDYELITYKLDVVGREGRDRIEVYAR